MEIQSLLVLSIACYISAVTGHGYMSKPASRNSMWRYGFKNPTNYDDNGLNCGGFSYQWDASSGKCGVCGDPYGGTQRHVYPGKYANGIIAATYEQGQVIDIEFAITAQHQGWIEFRLGDIGAKPITQAKLKYTLPVVGLDGMGTRFYFPPKSSSGDFKTKVKLPDDLSCDNCVLQWWWTAGNNWGCDNSGCGVGRGRQETFVNCADIKIKPSTKRPVNSKQPRLSTADPKTSKQAPAPTQQRVTKTKPETGETTKQPAGTTPQKPVTTSKQPATKTVPSNQDCKAVGIWKKVKGMDQWCKWNCPAFCPPSHCQCGTMLPRKKCEPVGLWKRVPGMTEWCNGNCPACPLTHCVCA